MNQSVRQTKMLTEAAAAAGIAAILVLLKLLAPVLVSVTMMTAAVPVAIICRYHGLRWALGTSFAVVCLVAMIGGPEIGLTTALYAGSLGCVMGNAMNRGCGKARIITETSVMFLIYMTYKISFSIYIMGADQILNEVIERFTHFVSFLWTSIAGLFVENPAPDAGLVTAAALALVALLYLFEAWGNSYISLDLATRLLARLKYVRR